jgi:hypothetical protein
MDCDDKEPSIEYCRGAEDCLDALIDKSTEAGMDLEKMVLIMADIVDELRTFRSFSFRQQWIPKDR